MGDMTYRQLGDSGLTVSAVGLGCNNLGRRLDKDATRVLIDAAIDVGITLFDTADIYGGEVGESEDLLGQALGGRRDSVVVATKFGMSMGGATLPDHEARGSRRYIRAAIEGSLRRLRTDYIDLYQIHRPDVRTPIEETLMALDDLVREGKVRYIGSSNFEAWQVADAAGTARAAGLNRFVSAQNEYSLLRREPDAALIPACERFGVGLLPFFPLASGVLTGKYRRDQEPPTGTRLSGDRWAQVRNDTDWDVVEALDDFAKARSLSMLDVAIGGLAAQPAVASVIAGATKPEQVQANVRALHWEPTPDDLAELDSITGAG
jgi:aryl-alcohol dehydrogenase-like predicted oxidoreductase